MSSKTQSRPFAAEPLSESWWRQCGVYVKCRRAKFDPSGLKSIRDAVVVATAGSSWWRGNRRSFTFETKRCAVEGQVLVAHRAGRSAAFKQPLEVCADVRRTVLVSIERKHAASATVKFRRQASGVWQNVNILLIPGFCLLPTDYSVLIDGLRQKNHAVHSTGGTRLFGLPT